MLVLEIYCVLRLATRTGWDKYIKFYHSEIKWKGESDCSANQYFPQLALSLLISDKHHSAHLC